MMKEIFNEMAIPLWPFFSLVCLKGIIFLTCEMTPEMVFFWHGVIIGGCIIQILWIFNVSFIKNKMRKEYIDTLK